MLMTLLVRVGGWLVIALFVTAVAEYVGHRYPMHRPLGSSRLMRRRFEQHVLKHHRGVNSPEVMDLWPMTHFTWGAPLMIAVGAIDWVGAAALACTFVCHALLFVWLHRAIHEVETNWTQRIPFFHELKRHHLDHHLRPSFNFGLVFPWTDLLFRTKWNGSSADGLRS
ncbi:MAG: sterol desaturase family protein [Betaproteobacteria bacterium]